MAMSLQHYPASLTNTPRGLVRPGPRYLFYSVVVLVSLLAFLALYLGMIAGAAYLTWVAINYTVDTSDRGQMTLKLVAMLSPAMVFLFLVKGLFKRQHVSTSGLTEITEAEQPELFAFIRQLCRDVRAPFPHRIYLSPEVNASVFYDTSLLNLIFPVRKNLVIGLGLVNTLPLIEFKAVLAHEFGHFSQSALALGIYVGVANRVIRDMVLGRDNFDRFVLELRQAGSYLILAGWALTGLIWVLRRFLTGVFYGINLGSFALMRETEYHADRVAVSVCGSDAIVQVLARLRFADAALQQAGQDVVRCAREGLVTRDLFYHQAPAAEYLRRGHKDPTLGKPPALPEDPSETVQVFPPVDGGRALWTTHPSPYDREKNAKRCYVRSPEDDRSPWLLFRDAEPLREAVTLEILRKHCSIPEDAPLADPAEVQKFIDEDHDWDSLNERYHGLFDRRFLNPGEVETLAREAETEPWTPARLRQAHDRLYVEGYQEFVRRRIECQKDLQFLSRLQSGELRLREKEFEFRGRRHPASAVSTLLEEVKQEAEANREQAAAIDRDIFLLHYQMALSAQPDAARELLERYAFQLPLQEVLEELQTHGLRTQRAFVWLSRAQKTTKEDRRKAGELFREARAGLGKALSLADTLILPPLPDLSPGDSLGRVLRPEQLVNEYPGAAELPSQAWTEQLLNQLGGLYHRTRSIMFHSISAILALQEQVARAWIERQ